MDYSTSTSSSTSSSKLPVLTIVIIVLVLAALLIVPLVCCCVHFYRKKKREAYSAPEAADISTIHLKNASLAGSYQAEFPDYPPVADYPQNY